MMEVDSTLNDNYVRVLNRKSSSGEEACHERKCSYKRESTAIDAEGGKNGQLTSYKAHLACRPLPRTTGYLSKTAVRRRRCLDACPIWISMLVRDVISGTGVPTREATSPVPRRKAGVDSVSFGTLELQAPRLAQAEAPRQPLE